MAEAARTGRAAVAARVPRVEREVVEGELFDDVRQSSRVLMSAMKENDRAARRRLHRRP